MSASPSTISELRRRLIIELSAILSKGEAQSVTRLILEHLGFSHNDILKDPSAHVNHKFQAEIKQIVGDLHKNRPIQYILGETEFYGITLNVDESVLIPRPETEELVDLIIKEESHERPVILDVGTGSGCIAIALGKHLPHKQVLAMDIDPDALGVARVNATANNVNVDFIQHSIFGFHLPEGCGKIDLLVSNPPYVTFIEKQRMIPRVLDNEPDIALFVPDKDPLLFYREIARLANDELAEEGIIWVEINEAYGKETRELFLHNGFSKAGVLKDIHGKDRFIKASR